MTVPDPLAGKRLLIVVNTDWFFLSHRLPLALAAQAAGADVTVVATDTGRADEIRAAGLGFEDARISRMGTNPLRELGTLAHLTRLFRRYRPDVVHLVATKALVYGGLAAGVTRTRGVVSAVTGAGYALGAGRNPALRRLVRTLLRLVLRRSAVVVFQIDADLDLYVRHGLVRREQARLVRGVGVDPDVWTAVPEPTEPVVMLAARMIAEKGVETFAGAARQLRPRFPDARFVLVGALDPDLPSAISPKTLDAWGHEGLVEWWGHRSDMHRAIAECQVFVLPSFHNEGVPKVLVEAAATARAVVASDIPGCRAVIDDGRTGYLVPARDPVLLAEAIGRLLANPWTRHRMAAAARADAAGRFRESELTEQMLDAYRCALMDARTRVA
jgi:glycosyltransferase involved in cell wall biosynthesis